MNAMPPRSESAPISKNNAVGVLFPLVGSGAPVSAGTVFVGVGVSVSIGVGVSVADGVASPNTWVPLLKISKTCVIATGLFDPLVVVIVMLCLPSASGFAGV